MMCKRGDIYFVDCGQNIDTCKQSGIRPAVITVVPLASKIYKKRMLPTHVYRRTVWLWPNRWKPSTKSICWNGVVP